MIEVFLGLGSLALKQPRNSSIRVGTSALRIDLNCSVEVCNRFPVPSLLQQGIAPIIVNGGKVRIDLDAPSIIKDCPIQVASRLSSSAAIAVCFGQPWVHGYSPIIVCQSLVDPALGHESVAPAAIRFREPRVEGYSPVIVCQCLIDVPFQN